MERFKENKFQDLLFDIYDKVNEKPDIKLADLIDDIKVNVKKMLQITNTDSHYNTKE